MRTPMNGLMLLGVQLPTSNVLQGRELARVRNQLERVRSEVHASPKARRKAMAELAQFRATLPKVHAQPFVRLQLDEKAAELEGAK